MTYTVHETRRPSIGMWTKLLMITIINYVLCLFKRHSRTNNLKTNNCLMMGKYINSTLKIHEAFCAPQSY